MLHSLVQDVLGVLALLISHLIFVVQADDFGSEVIPGAKDMGMHIQAYLYDGYWEDIGTVEAFYEANLALTDEPVPKFRSVWELDVSGVAVL